MGQSYLMSTVAKSNPKTKNNIIMLFKKVISEHNDVTASEWISSFIGWIRTSSTNSYKLPHKKEQKIWYV